MTAWQAHFSWDNTTQASRRCQLGPSAVRSHCGGFIVVLDGDLLNHLDVRHSLRFQQWRTTSAAETLVEGLAQREAAILTELRGSFSFACWDVNRGRLLLARDRLGISPLYLRLQEGAVQLASWRGALGCKTALNRQQVSEVLSFGHLLSPTQPQLGVTGDITLLPGGLVLWIEADGQMRHLRWWPAWPEPTWAPLPVRTARRAGALLREELERVVDAHLPACAPGASPVATLLNEDIDSAIVTAIASRQRPRAVEAFVLQPAGADPAASSNLQALAIHMGVKLHPVTISDTQIVPWVEAALDGAEQPSAGGLEIELLTRAVGQRGHTSVLSAMGGHALFGGHPSHQIVPWLRTLTWCPPPLRRVLLSTLLGPRAERFSELPHWDAQALTIACRRWVTARQLRELNLPQLSWPELPPDPLPAGSAQIAWAELFGYTAPLLVRDGISAGQRGGIALRLPLLDHRVVEIALRLPASIQGRGHRLLEQGFADLLPRGYRGQQGSACDRAMQHWLLGPLRPLCQHHLQHLHGAMVRNHGLNLPRSWVERQWQRFEAGSLHWTRIWCLVVVAHLTTVGSPGGPTPSLQR